MIKIGVSAFFFYPDPQRLVFSHKTIACLENDMAKYLNRPDVLPILIPDLEPDALKVFLAAMDGFVLQGGSDIAPETYRQKPLDSKKWPGDAYRDQYELKILDYAFKNNKPLLGICRGCQLLNVYFGGTLYQDLAVEKGSQHRDAKLYDKVSHRIQFVEGGLLAQLYGDIPEATVNSVHHQGIKALGKKLKREAFSPEDQLTEAVSYEDLKSHFVVGVQWHPEFSQTLKDKVIPENSLYDYFLQEVRGRMK